MTDPVTPNKGYDLPTTGEYPSTWGPVVNTNFTEIDNSLGGVTTISVTGVPAGGVNLTLTQYQPPNIIFTGTISGNLTYVVPSGVGGIWSVYNNTTGAFNVGFGVLSGTSVQIPQGNRVLVTSDQTNMSVAQSAASGGTPTAQVGLTPIAGTATTFIRSDGAPPINLAIAPTWTGVHTFNAAPVLAAGGFLTGTFHVNSAGIIDATGGALECATAVAGTSNQVAASTSFVATSFAPLASPQLVAGPGPAVPAAPTAVNGTNTTQIATTAFAYGILSAGTNGYQKFASGLILQWGRTAGGASPQAVTFPIAFPTACFSVVCTPSSSAVMTVAVSNPTVSLTGFSITASDVNPCSWVALGN